MEDRLIKYSYGPDIKQNTMLRERCVMAIVEKPTIAAPIIRCGNLYFWRNDSMINRVAVMSIIVENNESVEKLNQILHSNGEYIIGRMGIPYRKRGINIISIALDAPQDTISAMSGKIGNLPGVSVKTAYSAVIGDDE